MSPGFTTFPGRLDHKEVFAHGWCVVGDPWVRAAIGGLIRFPETSAPNAPPLPGRVVFSRSTDAGSIHSAFVEIEGFRSSRRQSLLGFAIGFGGEVERVGHFFAGDVQVVQECCGRVVRSQVQRVEHRDEEQDQTGRQTQSERQ